MNKPLAEIYGKRFFARRYKLNWRAPIVVDAIMDILSPTSVLDVGCATGDIVAEFQRRGRLAAGLEGSEEARDFAETESIFYRDLREPCKEKISFKLYDLVISLEVAEHIEPEFADNYLDHLVHYSDRILLSAAPPGQGGHYHVNCQPPDYWVDKFSGLGYDLVGDVVDKFRKAWDPWRKKPGIKAYWDNLMYFQKVGES